MRKTMTLKYKGYEVEIKWYPGNRLYGGIVSGIEHILEVLGATPEEAQADFRDMIDEYPAVCEEFGLEPCPPPDGQATGAEEMPIASGTVNKKRTRIGITKEGHFAYIHESLSKFTPVPTVEAVRMLLEKVGVKP